MGFVVFDEKLEPKPRLQDEMKPWWGGYELRFKIIERERYKALKGHLNKLRMNAAVTGAKQERTFTVDLSKFEYTEGKVKQEFNYYTTFTISAVW